MMDNDSDDNVVCCGWTGAPQHICLRIGRRRLLYSCCRNIRRVNRRIWRSLVVTLPSVSHLLSTSRRHVSWRMLLHYSLVVLVLAAWWHRRISSHCLIVLIIILIVQMAISLSMVSCFVVIECEKISTILSNGPWMTPVNSSSYPHRFFSLLDRPRWVLHNGWWTTPYGAWSWSCELFLKFYFRLNISGTDAYALQIFPRYNTTIFFSFSSVSLFCYLCCQIYLIDLIWNR